MRKISNYSVHLFSLLILGALTVGWSERDEYWLNAERGWGYALGIVGGSLMLLLLLYPVRKHWKFTRKWFAIQHWFRLHMLFGILGPVLILFHSNFQFGSLNSNIALISMLLVSSSGLVGRYAYQKIHRGLYGKQIEFSELKKSFDESKQQFLQSTLLTPKLLSQLTEIETRINKRKPGLLVSIKSMREISKIQKMLQQKTRQEARALLKDKLKLKSFTAEAKHFSTGIVFLKKMANYAVFARIFSMWHLFHLPIFFMMLATAIVHIVVVHMY